jgi:hypothetical protein
MAYSFVSAVIDAPIEDVWNVLRDFNGVGRYYSAVASSSLADDAPGDQVGALRTAHLAAGGVVQERLTALSDIDRSFSYTLIEDPAFPVKNYHSTVRLRAITDGNRTFIEWSSNYDITNGDDAGVHHFVEVDIYLTCIRGLQTMLGQSS